MKIIVIDNYDSFTYNLVSLLRTSSGDNVDVYRNNMVTPAIINRYDRIVLSPGPGIPDEAGLLKSIIADFADKKSIFGVCLGLQAIAEVFGATLLNLQDVFHGVDSDILVTSPEEVLFNGLSRSFKGGRYHSWVVSEKEIPNCLKITAVDPEGSIMAISHTEFNLKGVQFHPESILTPDGPAIISNWLKS